MMPGLGKFHRALFSVHLDLKMRLGLRNSIILYHHHLDATVGMQMVIVVA